MLGHGARGGGWARSPAPYLHSGKKLDLNYRHLEISHLGGWGPDLAPHSRPFRVQQFQPRVEWTNGSRDIALRTHPLFFSPRLHSVPGPYEQPFSCY